MADDAADHGVEPGRVGVAVHHEPRQGCIGVKHDEPAGILGLVDIDASLDDGPLDAITMIRPGDQDSDIAGAHRAAEKRADRRDQIFIARVEEHIVIVGCNRGVRCARHGPPEANGPPLAARIIPRGRQFYAFGARPATW